MITFAHAGEAHESTAEATKHLFTQPYLALPVFILVVIGLYYLLKAFRVADSTILLSELCLFFVVGIGAYSLVPAVSIFALSVGIGSALFVALSTLANH